MSIRQVIYKLVLVLLSREEKNTIVPVLLYIAIAVVPFLFSLLLKFQNLVREKILLAVWVRRSVMRIDAPL